jgi:hypothetical protein
MINNEINPIVFRLIIIIFNVMVMDKVIEYRIQVKIRSSKIHGFMNYFKEHLFQQQNVLIVKRYENIKSRMSISLSKKLLNR